MPTQLSCPLLAVKLDPDRSLRRVLMEPREMLSRYQNIAISIQMASSVLEALQAIQVAYDVDFATYHLTLTVADAVDTPYVRTTYPDRWVSHYLLSGYVKVDPVLREGLVRQMPFDWRDLEASENAVNFLLEAREYGLGANGYSIPVVDKKRRALFSLNSKKPSAGWRKIVDQFRGEWLELAFLIHRKAIFELHGEYDPVPNLGKREIECLYWTALGNNSKDIAAILRLSEHTTQSYLTSARNKLGAATIASAASLAIQLRLINPYSNTHK